MEAKPHVVIVGGGITGLSAAYYLQKRLKAAGVVAQLSIVDKAPALGGKIHTLERDGFVIEKGPDSFLARKRPIIELSRDLGLEGELTGTNPQAKKTYIVRRGKLHRMPPGLVLGIPTEFSPFLRTGLISPLGKARAAMDMLLPKSPDAADESLGGFLTRRLGKEVLEHIAEPLLAGIYAGDTFALSLQATFPQFQAMEQQHRSVILGMMANRKTTREEQADLPAAIRSSTFLTYRGGLQTLVRALEQALEGVDIRLGTGVETVRSASDGDCEVLLDNGAKLLAQGVVLTTPTYQTAAMLEDMPGSAELGQIEYVSVANVIMAFDRKDVPFDLDASGFLVPRSEGRTITACTWTSAKWLHTAPAGKALLRCYIGRSGEQEWLQWSDAELIQKARHDLGELLGLRAEPLFVEITRMPRSMPQYPVGHLEQLTRFRRELAARMPHVLATGAGFHGVGLPDCIRQGREAAEQLADSLLQRLPAGVM